MSTMCSATRSSRTPEHAPRPGPPTASLWPRSSEPNPPACVHQRPIIGTRKPTGIVRVATGVNDNLVPHAQARTMAVDWCGLGGKVVYDPINLPKGSSALLNHFGPLLTDQSTAVDWLAHRLAGWPAVSNCSILPLLP